MKIIITMITMIRIIDTKIIICLLLLLFSCNKDTPYPWFQGNLNDALDILDDKIIMLDFYTEW